MMTPHADALPAGRVALESARVALTRLGLRQAGGLTEALAQATRIASSALAVDRVSVWLFVDDGRATRCDYLHQPARSRTLAGSSFPTRDVPPYFQGLRSRQAVPIADIARYPGVAEFRDAYLARVGITALLNAPICRAGEVIGVVCHEQTGPCRAWTTTECEFAEAMGETIARLYEEAARPADSPADLPHLAHLEYLSALGRLAAGIAHDFSNTLTGIAGQAEFLLESHGGDPAVAHALGQIRAALDRGTALTTRLLTLGRVENRTLQVVDPRTVLQDYEPVLRLAAGPHVTLTVTAPAPPGQILVNVIELERVVLNLVVNARDAMPEGGSLRLTLMAHPPGHARDGGAFVVLEVRDTGVGMDGPTLRRIFEPFFTTKGDKGTGLGLMIVQQIVAQAGGFLEVESTEGRGTTLRVFFPALAKPGGAGATLA